MILCEGVTSISEVSSLVGRIQAVFDQPIEFNGHTLHLTASLGIAHSSPKQPLSGELLLDADAAMYRAKQQGGGHASQVIDLSEPDQTVTQQPSGDHTD